MKGTLSALLAVLLLVACGDDTNPASGGSGGAAPGNGGGGAGGAESSGGGVQSNGGAGAEGGMPSTSTGGSGGEAIPCTPLADLDAPNPTPSACDDNVAITCGQDGFLVEDACAPDETCHTYELQEWTLQVNGDWLEGRLVEWAGCIPTDAAPCSLEWNGHYYESELPYCEGPDKVWCGLPPGPVDVSPQSGFGTTDSWLHRQSCGANEICAGSDTIGSLTCLPEDTPLCDGTEPFCDNDTIVSCFGTWESEPGHRQAQACAGSDVCYEGTYQGNPMPFCRAPGEVPCDDETYTLHCDVDGTTVVGCWYGFTYHQSCATCFDDGQMVPCRCDTALGAGCSTSEQLACVPNSKPDCDPATDADYCDGDIAYRCLGYWEPYDCAAEGLECGVGAGVAGCRAANAPECKGTGQSCDGTEIVGCCDCQGSLFILFGPPNRPPCVPGFETRVDCADLGLTYSCEGTAGGFFAECDL
ncbi:MAG: hypothetical protein HOW73_21940 [Polyangiaceae bacterium]|nr:hypothetical protein [Polyangiaceae bacterium]